MNALQTPPGNHDHVLALCHMLANRTGKAFAPLLRDYHVTISEWRVIMSLAALGPLSGQEITDRWAMDKMAVNRAITRLVKRGLIEKKLRDNDRRIKNLLLTKTGSSMYELLLPVTIGRFQELMSCLNVTEEKQLSKLLTKLITHVDALSD
jgi:DNA-binding MarR family transcriptional regulator